VKICEKHQTSKAIG